MATQYRDDPQLGGPVPEESLVLFADLLGFSDRVNEAFSKGAGAELLRDVRAAVEHASAAFRIGYLAERIIVQVVSDSVIVGVPLRNPIRIHVHSENKPAEVRLSSKSDAISLVVALGRFQRRLIRSGFLVRGAVTVGGHFMGEGLVAGPALVEAVRLEGSRGEVARLPRINLHRSFVRELNEDDGLPEYQNGAWLCTNLVGVGCDQQDSPIVGEGPRSYFIDYLALAHLQWHDEERWPKLRGFLDHHRAMIEAGLKHPRDGVRKKYEWMRDYHDARCSYPGIVGREALHIRRGKTS